MEVEEKEEEVEGKDREERCLLKLVSTNFLQDVQVVAQVEKNC